jgi:hypothetical protein
LADLEKAVGVCVRAHIDLLGVREEETVHMD